MKTGEKRKLEFVENLIQTLEDEECKTIALQGIITGLKNELAMERSARLKAEADLHLQKEVQG